MMDSNGNPRLLGINIPGVRLVWMGLDELHIYIDALSLYREAFGPLMAALGNCQAAESTFEVDHIRLWWD